MNKTVKIVVTALLFVMVLSLSINVFAGTSIGGITVNPNTGESANLVKAGNKVLGVVKIIGIFASVAILMVVGIRYMMGSAEEKAQYKKVMIPYIIGAVLLFAASTIVDKLSSFKLF